MKVKSIVFIGGIAILGVLNIPGLPLAVKLALTSVLLGRVDKKSPGQIKPH